MKKQSVLRQTAQFYGKHLGEGALCVLLQLVLRLMVAAPLLFLITTEIPYLALLCVPLYLLIIPVARQNMAEAMQDALSGGLLFSVKLVSWDNYGKKFLSGLKQAGLMLLWAALFIAATGVALWAYSGEIDAFTLVRTLMNLGGGSFMDGIKLVLVIYAATLLPIVLGCAFHSGARHARALGNKKLLRGHRLGVIGTWVLGLIVLIPFAAVAAVVGAGFVSGLVEALGNLGSGSISLPSLGKNVYIILGAAVVLLLPALPFKQMMTAIYVRRLHDAA